MSSAFLINFAFFPLMFFLSFTAFKDIKIVMYPYIVLAIGIFLLVDWLPTSIEVYKEDGELDIFTIIPLSISYGLILGVVYSFFNHRK